MGGSIPLLGRLCLTKALSDKGTDSQRWHLQEHMSSDLSHLFGFFFVA